MAGGVGGGGSAPHCAVTNTAAQAVRVLHSGAQWHATRSSRQMLSFLLLYSTSWATPQRKATVLLRLSPLEPSSLRKVASMSSTRSPVGLSDFASHKAGWKWEGSSNAGASVRAAVAASAAAQPMTWEATRRFSLCCQNGLPCERYQLTKT